MTPVFSITLPESRIDLGTCAPVTLMVFSFTIVRAFLMPQIVIYGRGKAEGFRMERNLNQGVQNA